VCCIEYGSARQSLHAWPFVYLLSFYHISRFSHNPSFSGENNFVRERQGTRGRKSGLTVNSGPGLCVSNDPQWFVLMRAGKRAASVTRFFQTDITLIRFIIDLYLICIYITLTKRNDLLEKGRSSRTACGMTVLLRLFRNPSLELTQLYE
jgi:hypothetical protein